MNFKTVLSCIHERQLKTLCTVSYFNDNLPIEKLPTKHRGLYWIWTSLSFEFLKKIKTNHNTKEVPIAKLVSERQGLKNICDIKKSIEVNNENRIADNIEEVEFRIVYNGIGGYKRESKSSGLRERILQELNCNSPGTGTLNILNRSDSEKDWDIKWAVSHFDFDDEDNIKILKSLECEGNLYDKYAKAIESNWRIEYGVPILTRH